MRRASKRPPSNVDVRELAARLGRLMAAADALAAEVESLRAADPEEADRFARDADPIHVARERLDARLSELMSRRGLAAIKVGTLLYVNLGWRSFLNIEPGRVVAVDACEIQHGD